MLYFDKGIVYESKARTAMGAPDPRFPAQNMTPTKNINRHKQTDVVLTIPALGVKSTSRHQRRRTQNPNVSVSGIPNVSESKADVSQTVEGS